MREMLGSIPAPQKNNDDNDNNNGLHIMHNQTRLIWLLRLSQESLIQEILSERFKVDPRSTPMCDAFACSHIFSAP